MSGAPTALPADLTQSLMHSFVIRLSHRGRRTGQSRVLEATFAWDGGARVYLSGYPGKRDWVANLLANPRAVLHTVERGVWYDIPCEARVLRRRQERMGPLFLFIERWASAPRGRLFRWVAGAARLADRLHIPGWGPLYPVRSVMDRMPCVELTFVADPARRASPPPAPTGH